MAPRRSPTSLLPRRAQLADRVGDLLPCRASQVTRGRYVATGSSGRELRPNRALCERPSRASSALWHIVARLISSTRRSTRKWPLTCAFAWALQVSNLGPPPCKGGSGQSRDLRKQLKGPADQRI